MNAEAHWRRARVYEGTGGDRNALPFTERVIRCEQPYQARVRRAQSTTAGERLGQLSMDSRPDEPILRSPFSPSAQVGPPGQRRAAVLISVVVLTWWAYLVLGTNLP